MNIGSLLNLATKMLNSKKIDTARLDSQLILGKVLNKDKIYLMINSNEEVEEKDEEEFLKKYACKIYFRRSRFYGIRFLHRGRSSYS